MGLQRRAGTSRKHVSGPTVYLSLCAAYGRRHEQGGRPCRWRDYHERGAYLRSSPYHWETGRHEPSGILDKRPVGKGGNQITNAPLLRAWVPVIENRLSRSGQQHQPVVFRPLRLFYQNRFHIRSHLGPVNTGSGKSVGMYYGATYSSVIDIELSIRLGA